MNILDLLFIEHEVNVTSYYVIMTIIGKSLSKFSNRCHNIHRKHNYGLLCEIHGKTSVITLSNTHINDD